MKLGVGFNIFNGEEFLKPALLNVQGIADVVIVMYSSVSLTGTNSSPFLQPLINNLKKERLIDVAIECKSEIYKDGSLIQNGKRKKYEVGRKIAQQMGCTHFMLRDCDEFYDKLRLKKALSYLNQYDLLIAPIYDYIGNPPMRSKNITKLKVPVAHRCDLRYQACQYPVLMDLGRTVLTPRYKILYSDELVMHHFTGTRYNAKEVKRKFEGHSHFTRLGTSEQNTYIQRIMNPEPVLYDKVREDCFGILRYWETEWKLFYEQYENL